MKKRGMTVVTLILAAALVAVGATEGQAKEVLMKAVRVCLECIGVG
ncbi:MAG: thioredoxin [Oscillospiraceae bacterium]|nr:thioredoxin [Oscillospiraceae bacterium]